MGSLATGIEPAARCSGRVAAQPRRADALGGLYPPRRVMGWKVAALPRRVI